MKKSLQVNSSISSDVIFVYSWHIYIYLYIYTSFDTRLLGAYFISVQISIYSWPDLKLFPIIWHQKKNSFTILSPKKKYHTRIKSFSSITSSTVSSDVSLIKSSSPIIFTPIPLVYSFQLGQESWIMTTMRSNDKHRQERARRTRLARSQLHAEEVIQVRDLVCPRRLDELITYSEHTEGDLLSGRTSGRTSN